MMSQISTADVHDVDTAGLCDGIESLNIRRTRPQLLEHISVQSPLWIANKVHTLQLLEQTQSNSFVEYIPKSCAHQNDVCAKCYPLSHFIEEHMLYHSIS